MEKIRTFIFGNVFRGHVLISFFGGIVSSAILFLAGILFARYLGPAEYGKGMLFVYAAQLLYSILIMGLDVAVSKNISEKSNAKDSKVAISSSIVAVFFFLLFWLVMYGFANIFMKPVIFGWNIAGIGILLIIMHSFKIYFEGIVRGLKLFSYQALNRIAEALLILLAFFALMVIMGKQGSVTLMNAYALGSLAAIIFYIKVTYPFFDRKAISIQTVFNLLKHGFMVAISYAVLSAYLLGDKLIIKETLGEKTLGIYSVYYMVAVSSISMVAAYFSNVFFAYAASRSDKKKLVYKIDKLIFKALAPMFFLFATFIYFAIAFLFGDNYPPEPLYALLFALFGLMYLFANCYLPIIAGHNSKLFMKYNAISLVKLVAFVLIVYLGYGSQYISIESIVSLLAINYFLEIFIARRVILSEKQCAVGF